ncbi:MAG: hypothetical protein M1820_005497 [Bogoriella megaspora]|nr:MAG: hypothetical protein M1820_005497 [Bogoriella megaspora]
MSVFTFLRIQKLIVFTTVRHEVKDSKENGKKHLTLRPYDRDIPPLTTSLQEIELKISLQYLGVRRRLCDPSFEDLEDNWDVDFSIFKLARTQVKRVEIDVWYPKEDRIIDWDVIRDDSQAVRALVVPRFQAELARVAMDLVGRNKGALNNTVERYAFPQWNETYHEEDVVWNWRTEVQCHDCVERGNPNTRVGQELSRSCPYSERTKENFYLVQS